MTTPWASDARGDLGLERRFLPSPLHEVYRQVTDFASTGGQRRIAHLHVGEPGFGPPAEVTEAVRRCFVDGDAGYGEAAGSLRLRAVLADKVQRENALSAEPERILVTPGSTQALYAVLTALTKPGDRVLLPLPFWPIYRQQCAALSLEPHFYRVGADGQIDPEALAALLRLNVSAILVNSPSNPAGAVLSRSTLERVLELSAPFGTPIVSDEAYEDFAFDAPHASIGAIEAESGDRRRVFTTYTFSKTFALTGLRVGYIVAPTAYWFETLLRVQQASLVCPSTPAQAGAMAAMQVRADAVGRARIHLKAARDAAIPPLLGAGLIECAPAGGWYAMCRLPRTTLSEDRLRAYLLHRHGVGIAPGWPFQSSSLTATRDADLQEHTFRIALCGPIDEVRHGVDRLCEMATGFHDVYQSPADL